MTVVEITTNITNTWILNIWPLLSSGKYNPPQINCVWLKCIQRITRINGDIFRTPAVDDAWPWRRSDAPDARHGCPHHPRRHPAPGGQHSIHWQIQWEPYRMFWVRPQWSEIVFSHQLADAGQRWRDVMEQLSPSGLHLLLHGQVRVCRE